MHSPDTRGGSKNAAVRDDVTGRGSALSVAPSISLPKGGGAIRGMGEKFAANPVTGTGSMSIPIAVSPGRSGFSPQLSLSYDSGSGNGPFGFGWSISLPSITRKTDKGLPKYLDAAESDAFILSGAEDLVPVLIQDKDGKWNREEPRTGKIGEQTYRVYRYRPRIEGLFARIEQWTNENDSEDTFWRSISKDNVTTWYGIDQKSRIFDPLDPTHIFSWLISESYDDKGNAILYEYKEENSEGIDTSQAHEQNRNDSTRSANRYLKKIRYGNRIPRLLQPDLSRMEWLFEVVFDYGEHDASNPRPNDQGQWLCRPDPFSSYRASFEIRSYRLCQRVLMFHHFPDEPGMADALVRSTEFIYDPTPIASFIRKVTHSGHVQQGQDSWLKKSLPPLEFEYSQAIVKEEICEIDPVSLENLPAGLDDANYQWVDLDGEGISGFLTEQADAWHYKPNLGSGRFGPLEEVASIPSLAALRGGRQQLLDLAGDGQLDLAEFSGPAPGFYERTEDQDWIPFKPFPQLPRINWGEPNLRFVDLNGDGHADILISEDHVFTWHASLAEEGFGPAQRVSQSADEEKGPKLVFADGTQSIYLADISGDGLTDLARIRNGEICYWPNLGYGRFGAKVTMDNAPRFDSPDQFDQRRIRLADIDGSGVTDIIYLKRDGVRLYFNQSGNGWSKEQRLDIFPPTDNLSAVTVIDLLGNGTACLVWSSPLPCHARRPMRYVDLMGGRKPHLMTRMKNNLGAETVVHYVSSTKFYLEDKAAGNPWITRLPFPVHVVERVETFDRISQNHFVSAYKYHHGYFDGIEREFRGFGMVEEWDTDEFNKLDQNATNVDKSWHAPPMHTKTWFHTGAYFRGKEISRHLAIEYFGAPRDEAVFQAWAKGYLLDDTVLPDAELSADEQRQACRALKGAMLRQEVYADDDSAKASLPYTVTEQNFTIELLQPRAGNRYAVFFTHPREAITYHYERNLDDPRVTHAMTLETDRYGNALKSLEIGYGRKQSMLPEQRDRDKQTALLVTYTESDVTNAIDDAAPFPDEHRTPLPADARTYELTGFKPENNAARFSFVEFSRSNFALLASAKEIPYEQTANRNQKQKRLIEHTRTLYRKNDLTAFSLLGTIESHALPGESYKLAYTPGLLNEVYKRKRPGQPDEELLDNPVQMLEGKGADQGGYLLWDDNWWIPSGRSYFDTGADIFAPANTAAMELSSARRHFYQPRKFANPFGQSAAVDYDADDLLVTRTRDALGNTTAAENDYRVLQPRLVTDPNRNRTAAAFDALGLVVATAVMGKVGENIGDRLEDFDANPPLAALQDFVADPRAQAAALLGKASTSIVYDLERFTRTGQPPFAATLARETHCHEPGGAQTRIQIHFSYSDGFGREIQKKAQAEAGDAPQRQANVPMPTGDIAPGGLVRDSQGKLAQANTPRRWVGTGRTVFNNKGKPVRQYEPFFSATHLYEPEREMTDAGVSPVLFYDPVERVIATLHPNNTYEKVIFDPWQQITYDVNDTVAANGTETGAPRTDKDIKSNVREYFKTQPATWQTWHAQRIGNQMGAAEREAALKAAVHANTPAIAHVDALGRTFLTIAHNRFERNGAPIEESYATRVKLDIEGNQREILDARDRIVMRYDYDLLGNRIRQASMEAGERWMLNDAMGKPIRTWDSRRFIRRMTYDALRRPVGLFVTENNGERLAEQTIYGEDQGDNKNHRTRVYQIFDGAGKVTNEEYDFKGNLLHNKRELLPGYKNAVDWLQNPLPADGTYTSGTRYDALNRPVAVTSPDGSVYRPTFNEANLLDKVDVNLRGAAVATPFVTNINYNPKGQRETIAYENGALTTYEYDPLSFRLTHLKTTRPPGLNGLASQIFADPAIVQDLRYTYDPAGNITRIEDAAIERIFHAGEEVKPVCDYAYDAIYRLIEATGREHIGQTAFDFDPPNGNRRDYPFVGIRAHPNDAQAMRNYTERYEYDEVGNFNILRHLFKGGGWNREYFYEEPSLLEPGKMNNRLTRTRVGGFTETYTYQDAQGNDAHGCMTAINAMTMVWDFEDQLQRVALGEGGVAYYVYDAAGQRVRKVIESQNGNRQKERIYVSGFEIYREHSGNGINKTLERESLHVTDDKQRIALVEAKTSDNGNPIVTPVHFQRYQLGNHLGSASLELDKIGALISYEEYHSYGTTAFQTGRSAAEVSAKRYRHTGEERNEESGLQYHRIRYYASWIGRWSSTDPAGVIASVNLYEYASDNPVKLIDPGGTIPYETIPPPWNETREMHVPLTITSPKQEDSLAPDKQKPIHSYPPIENNPSPTQNYVFPVWADVKIARSHWWDLRSINTPTRIHAGLDITASKGTPVVAFASGQIVTAKPMKGGGRTVIIHGDDRNTYVYMHLDKFASELKVGESVKAGELIGHVGNTTGARIDKKTGRLQERGGAHLHFQIHLGHVTDPRNERRIDPYDFIMKSMGGYEYGSKLLSPQVSEEGYEFRKSLGLARKAAYLQNIVFGQPATIPKLSDVLTLPRCFQKR